MILCLDLGTKKISTNRPSINPHHRWGDGSRVSNVNCSCCGKNYTDYTKQINKTKNHYCSKDCYAKSRVGSKNPNWNGGLAKCKCKECGTDFEIFQASVKYGEGKFCSMKCKVLNQTIYASARERGREGNRKRDARKRAVIKTYGSHTLTQWHELLKKHDSKCVKCGTTEKITRDHIIPLSKGGTDLIFNIQPLCHSCNCRKNSRIL